MDKKLSKSFEDYIEAAYLIKKRKKVVRVKDIADALNVSLPSVTEAIKKLARRGLVVYEKYGLVELTKRGEKAAKGVYKKHKTLSKFLITILGLDEETALHDACIMEHGLSRKTLARLIKFIKKIDSLMLKNLK